MDKYFKKKTILKRKFLGKRQLSKINSRLSEMKREKKRRKQIKFTDSEKLKVAKYALIYRFELIF
jgi:hypothetical protein